MTDDIHHLDLERDARITQWKRQAKQAARARRKRNLYIITLHPDVLEREEFRLANPGYVEGMPCVYVGLTIHEPGERYQQHKSGYRSQSASAASFSSLSRLPPSNPSMRSMASSIP